MKGSREIRAPVMIGFVSCLKKKKKKGKQIIIWLCNPTDLEFGKTVSSHIGKSSMWVLNHRGEQNENCNAVLPVSPAQVLQDPSASWATFILVFEYRKE